jgi:hypothetical protein
MSTRHTIPGTVKCAIVFACLAILAVSVFS